MNIDFRNNVSRQLYTNCDIAINGPRNKAHSAAVVVVRKTTTQLALTALAWVGTFFLWIPEEAVRSALALGVFGVSLILRIFIVPCFIANNMNGSCNKVMQFIDNVDLFIGIVAGGYDFAKQWVDKRVDYRTLSGLRIAVSILQRHLDHRNSCLLSDIKSGESSNIFSFDLNVKPRFSFTITECYKDFLKSLPREFLTFTDKAKIAAINTALENWRS